MSAFTYKYKVNTHTVPAEVAGAVCDTLSHTPGGLTPKRLVDKSRPVDSPMHPEFEWDDAIAGEKYREQQASDLIKHLVIVRIEEEEKPARIVEIIREENTPEEKFDKEFGNSSFDRAFVSTGERNGRYIPIKIALSDSYWRTNLLEQAKRDLISFKLKYHRLSELADIFKDIDDLLGA